MLLACADLPVPGVGRSAVPEDTPTVVGPRGRLVEAQADRMLERIESRSAADDILQRHVAAEEEIAGMPLSAGNRVTLLEDGPSTYASMFDAIEAARDHINVEFYIIEDDEVGRRFARRLIEKAAEGIAIRLIYDSVGSLTTPSAFFEDLRQAGIQVVEFNPVNPLDADEDWNVNNRDHRKIVVVDGRVAFLGGINISGVYSRGSAPGGSGGSGGSSGLSRGSGEAGWRDTNVRIEGPAVAQIQLLFLNTWMRQGGGALRERDWFPRPARRGSDLVRVIASEAGGESPAIYLTLLSVIEHAELSVHLTMAYFVPDTPTLEALMRSARRGVDVKIIVPSRSDFWAVFYAGRASYSRLMRAGVKLYERQGTLLHSKTAVIDGIWSTVGSSNIDTRSFLHNNEINAVVLGTEFAAEMRAMFERDLALSKRIEADDWARRGLRDRVLELAARIWSHWL
jgi:cardiolipin synthase